MSLRETLKEMGLDVSKPVVTVAFTVLGERAKVEEVRPRSSDPGFSWPIFRAKTHDGSALEENRRYMIVAWRGEEPVITSDGLAVPDAILNHTIRTLLAHACDALAEAIAVLPTDDALKMAVHANEDRRLRRFIAGAISAPRDPMDNWQREHDLHSTVLPLLAGVQTSPYRHLIEEAVMKEANRVLANIGPGIAANIRRDLFDAAKMLAPEEAKTLPSSAVDPLSDQGTPSDLCRIDVYGTDHD